MWTLKSFDQLTTRQLHAIYKARTDVFVVEQNCPYPEVDDLDLIALHLFLENSGAIAAYCRIIPGEDLIKLGRVLVSAEHRKEGLGQKLVAQTLKVCQEQFPDQTIYAQAQAHLENFYGHFGFVKKSQAYLEDGIPHIDMLLEKTNDHLH
ncbi:GNAT family N-acetyltransferase [Streptococcus loxodontisalivarius]|uniref:ElaA protein n=1 Tax=Streptococcus loxodontisalivarius TaxID=1349415 RepID=A0ABS2PQE8_9STRE|nr:GNAT family N-acetyltransferase [Streptococcus loxodontisalivarius]MBM7642173.1 ElaA protein [Streptococcus loxodontisalivarius]